MKLYDILWQSGWKDDATIKSIIFQVDKWLSQKDGDLNSYMEELKKNLND